MCSTLRPVCRRVLLVIWLCCATIGSAWASAGTALFFQAGTEPGFLESKDVFQLQPAVRQDDGWQLEGRIAAGYYVYRHAIKLVDAQGQTVSLSLPAGTPRYDDFFGQTEIYTSDAFHLRWPATVSGPLVLHWQGCAEAGICYPPATIPVMLPPAATVIRTRLSLAPDDVSVQAATLARPSSTSRGAGVKPRMADDQAAAHELATLGPVAATLLFFGFGLLLAFTPCTLPMIPIVSTLVVGSQARARRALLLSSSYVLAMAGTYAAVGAAAGLAGANLQAALQSPWLLSALAVLFLILAGALFGLFELRPPAALSNRLASAGRGQRGGSLVGAAVLGSLSALLVGPCMTAPLAGALLYIGQSGSAWLGGLALFALGLGMGLPLLGIAVFGARVLPRPGVWMERVRIVFGYVMVGMAVMMLARFLPSAAGLALWGGWMFAIAAGLLAWGRAVATRHWLAWTLRAGAVCAGLWSGLLLSTASGGDSALQRLAPLQVSAGAPTAAGMTYMPAKSAADVDTRITEAGMRGQWTLIDFYADWCVSCHVIERKVFGAPAVAARLASMQIVRPNVTRDDEQDRALLRRWQVQGPPTLILIGPDGLERRAQRVVGDIDAGSFLEQLDAAGVP